MRFDAWMTFKLPTEMRSELYQIAREDGRSVSDVLRRMLTDGIHGYRAKHPRPKLTKKPSRALTMPK